jgi:hypothetical protein
MSDPNGVLAGVVITSREIYDAVVRLTGRVDVLITQQADAHADLQDHEARIRSLEKARWPLPAVSLLISLGALALAAAERILN